MYNIIKYMGRLAFMALPVIGVASCNDKNDDFDDHGSSTVLSLKAPESVNMADSILFTYNVASHGMRLNQSKLQLYVGGEMSSERIMLTPTDGEYSGKLYIPYLQNIDDQNVVVKVRSQNERFSTDTLTQTVRLTRPHFDRLVLTDRDGSTYEMLPVDGQPFTYSVTGDFPLDFYARITAPAYGENGNAVEFGNSNGKITNGVTDFINFQAEQSPYTITFNTKTYQGSPFVKFGVNRGEEVLEFTKVDDNNFKVDADFKQNEDLTITGLKTDYANYWINPSYFSIVRGSSGKTLRFRGQDGRYRIVCDKSKKYFRVYPLSASDELAALPDQEVIWVIGDGNIGMPSYAKNKSGWNAKEGNAIALCPIGNHKHQLILEAGRTLNPNSINFKFFYQNGWGGEFKQGNYKEVALNDILSIPASDGNIRAGGTKLNNGEYWIITVDLSNGANAAVITAEKATSIPEVEP